MGCDIVVAGADEPALEAIRRLFAERDRVFSRFRPDSELSSVNRAAGEPTLVSHPVRRDRPVCARGRRADRWPGRSDRRRLARRPGLRPRLRRARRRPGSARPGRAGSGLAPDRAHGAAAAHPVRLRDRPERRRQGGDGRRGRRPSERRRLRLGRRRSGCSRRDRRRAAGGRRRPGRPRRDRHHRHGAAALAPRRRLVPPPDRSRDRVAGTLAVARGERVRGVVPRRRRGGALGAPRGRRRPRVARPARPSGPVRRRGRAGDRQPHLDGDDDRAGMHLTSNPVDWYAARAAGIVAYLLLTAVVTLGIAMAGRAPGRRWKRWPMFAVEDVHRVGGLLVGSFIALHVVTIAIDSFLPFSLGQLAIPLTSRYRPIWTALGIVAAELLRRAGRDQPLPRADPAPHLAQRPLRQLRRSGPRPPCTASAAAPTAAPRG